MRLHQFLMVVGFSPSKTDTSLFVYQAHGVAAYLLVYVDDIIVTSSHPSFLESIISKLGDEFSIHDLGCLSLFLGIEVKHTATGLYLSQKQYIANLITRAAMHNCKPVRTLMAPNVKLHAGDSPLFDDPTLYRTIVGALQYVTLTRPDLAFVVNKVCQFMHSPSQNQWVVVKSILRYLKLTMHHQFIIPCSSNLVLQAFTDSDWAGSLDDRKSTGGYAIFLENALISWSSKKQRTVARSRQPNLNIKLLLMLQLSSRGCSPCSLSSTLRFAHLLCCGVTILVQPICPSIQFFMPAPSMWR